MSKQTFTTGQVLTAAEMTTLQANDYNQTVSAKVASYVLVAADAGTRITMSNASATTVTVNTALFAAGDTLIITNIGVGVSTITAGTATVSTGGSLALNQYDSGTLYFTSTGVAIWNGANPGDITGVTAGTGISGGGTSGSVTVSIDTTVTADLTTTQTLSSKTLTTPKISTYTTNGDLVYGTGSGALTRLGVGSTSQVLTVAGGVPTWNDPVAGGMTLITTTTVDNSTGTYTYSSLGSYKHILIVGEQMTQSGAAAAAEWKMRFNGDSTASYTYSVLQANGTSAASAICNAGSTPVAGMIMCSPTGASISASGQNDYRAGTFAVWVYDYNTSAAYKTVQWNGGAQPDGTRSLSNGNGMWVNAAAITSISLIMTAGTFKTGTIRIYGVS